MSGSDIDNLQTRRDKIDQFYLSVVQSKIEKNSLIIWESHAYQKLLSNLAWRIQLMLS